MTMIKVTEGRNGWHPVYINADAIVSMKREQGSQVTWLALSGQGNNLRTTLVRESPEDIMSAIDKAESTSNPPTQHCSKQKIGVFYSEHAIAEAKHRIEKLANDYFDKTDNEQELCFKGIPLSWLCLTYRELMGLLHYQSKEIQSLMEHGKPL